MMDVNACIDLSVVSQLVHIYVLNLQFFHALVSAEAAVPPCHYLYAVQ